jgi:hypothetical protein
VKVNFKPYKFILASILFCYSANGQNLQKKYEEAYRYYEKKEYSKAEEVCSQILLAGPKSVKDLNDIWINHTAAYLMYFMYHDSTNANFNLKISKDYLDVSKEYIDLLLSKDSKLKEKLQPRIRMIDSIAATFIPIKEANITTVDNKNSIKAATQETPTSATSSSNVVLVIAEGQGKTKDLAVNNALRSAIEKTFGAFISSNSKIVDDNLIKDEIVSISNGNILNYEIISQIEKNELFAVTISANISPENIIINANKSGSTFELNGGVYYQNILKEEFYKSQEPIVLKNFFEQWQSVNLFDYKVNELEMFRYVAQTSGEFWMPRFSQYLRYDWWEFYQKDLIQYNNEQLLAELTNEIEQEHKTSWDYLPKKYMGTELFQIPYIIKVTTNENYIQFIKSYAELLHILSIRNIEAYKLKYGEPFIFWHLVYDKLIAAIQSRSRYSDPVLYSKLGAMIRDIQNGPIALRNEESVEILCDINSIVLNQNNCMNLYVDGIKNLSFPPAFHCFSREGDLPKFRRYCGGIEEFEFPYPTDRRDFNFEVYCILTFTKDELSKLNKKISFDFSLRNKSF